jgi:transcriptional regulator with XRE-family HTH domain
LQDSLNFFATFPAVTDYAALIDRAIEASGLTQREVAERLDVSEATVSNWIRGVRPPVIQKINAVCALLSISPDQLLRAIGIELHPPAAAKLSPQFLRDLLYLNDHDPETLRAIEKSSYGLRLWSESQSNQPRPPRRTDRPAAPGSQRS